MDNTLTDKYVSDLFSSSCEFIAGAGTLESLPPYTCPEIGFIGRSNVGKSSLVNALIGRNALARVSANPGHTQQLNFYNLGGRLVLVDMPGYGYAKVSKQKKGEWDHLIRSYLSGRPTLKRTCLLIDARRGVMDRDEEFMELLDDCAQTFHIVLTKIDALTGKELQVLLQNVGKTVQAHVAAHPEVIATSSLQKEGIHALQEHLAPFAHT